MTEKQFANLTVNLWRAHQYLEALKNKLQPQEILCCKKHGIILHFKTASDRARFMAAGKVLEDDRAALHDAFPEYKVALQSESRAA